MPEADDLDEARRRATNTLEAADEPSVAAVYASLYVGDCIRYLAATQLFIAEHRTIDPRPHA